jgi:hypothetical protein
MTERQFDPCCGSVLSKRGQGWRSECAGRTARKAAARVAGLPRTGQNAAGFLLPEVV